MLKWQRWPVQVDSTQAMPLIIAQLWAGCGPTLLLLCSAPCQRCKYQRVRSLRKDAGFLMCAFGVQTSGTVDQQGGMLSEDVIEKGYALMCMATPTSDCSLEEITEAEILDEQLCA